MQIKANGHDVYGFGERKTPEPFVNACTTFVYLDSIDDPEAPTPAAAPPAKTKTKVKKDATTSEPAAKPARSLAQDTKLVTILRGGVEAAAREDGWALLSAAGSAAKRQAPIDPRNYGVKNFPALFEAPGCSKSSRPKTATATSSTNATRTVHRANRVSSAKHRRLLL